MAIFEIYSTPKHVEECELSLKQIILCWESMHGMNLDGTPDNCEWYSLTIDLHPLRVWWHYALHMSWKDRRSVYEGEYQDSVQISLDLQTWKYWRHIFYSEAKVCVANLNLAHDINVLYPSKSVSNLHMPLLFWLLKSIIVNITVAMSSLSYAESVWNGVSTFIKFPSSNH